MNPKKNSQSAIEFIILVGFILFFFTLFFLLIQQNMDDKIKEKQNAIVRETAMGIQNEINLAFQSGEGYYREFIVPENINGKDYSVQIVQDLVYVKTLDNQYSISLPIKNITGNITKGINTIKKDEGIIKLNV